MEKNVKIVEISVKEYVNEYNNTHTDKINRYNVYDLIKKEKLKAHKGYRGAWVIEKEVVEKPSDRLKKLCIRSKKTYSTREFTKLYNEKHPNNQLTLKQVRYLIEIGVIDAVKKSGKWQISADPRKRIK